MFAKRMESIGGSGVRKMFNLIASMENPINLSIGQAHYDAPPAVKQAAIEAIEAGHNRYTVTEGIPELREATLASLDQHFGYLPESILMTTGVSGGLLLAFLALVDVGDEVLVPDPYFVMYTNVAAIAGGQVRYYDLYPKQPGGNWRPDLAEIEASLTDKTKVILINSPGNPTGSVWSALDLDALVDLCKTRGIWILSDEIYSHFTYDQDYVSVIPAMRHYDRILSMGGFSKTYGIPGWRLGWTVGPEACLDAMQILQQYTYVCCPTPLQEGAVAAFDVDMGGRATEYRAKRDLVYERLKDHFDLCPSEGSFYAFPSIPKGWEEEEFVQACIQSRVLIVPGSAFSRRGTHFRLSFAADDDTLELGLNLLVEIAEQKA